MYRINDESPTICGSVVVPRELAAYVRRALILQYTNIGVVRESVYSSSSSGKRSETATTSTTSRKRSLFNRDAFGLSNSKTTAKMQPWSQGPRQDPILGLTSHICHSHLTKCEILAFDEVQGEIDRNRHMTLLRDATALWTSVLQLF